MYGSGRLTNFLQGSIQMEYLTKRYPLYWQDGYHYFIEWLQKYAPEKLPVFFGKETHDYSQHFSLERHKLWHSCQWCCEWMDRADRDGIPLPHSKIDASIRKELGLPYMPHLLNFDELRMHALPDDFTFESFLRTYAIDFFGLPVFIAVAEIFVNAFQDWSPRYLKVSKALIYQEFIAEGLLDEDEQRIYARLFVNFCTKWDTFPRLFFESMDTNKMIRTYFALHEPETIQAIPKD